MAHWAITAKRWSILTHRWMGVFFCVLFALWFLSGVVLMYWDYPQVHPENRLAKLPALDAATIRVSPAQALAASGLATEPQRVRVNMVAGRPVYRFHGPARSQVAVWADTGEKIAPFPREAARREAALFARLPEASAQLVSVLDEPDQWTLNKAVRPLSPWYKFAFRDPAATEVYVSGATGEVLQATNRESRLASYFGAITHWLYIVPLRKQTPLWRATIIGLSAAGVLMCLAGIVIGLWLYSPSKRYRSRELGPTSIPYSGMKRWHTILGLFFGLCTFTWILSGLFSMNPFSWSPETAPSPAHVRALRGGGFNLSAFALPPGEAVRRAASALPAVKELELVLFDGAPLYLALHTPQNTRLIANSGDVLPALSRERLLAAARRTLPGVPVQEAELLHDYDAYYYTRHYYKPLPVLRVRYRDPVETWQYLDARSGQLVESYVALSRLERWLYHGLHSLDFPFLYRHRPVWDFTLIALCLGGFVLSFTSVWIAWSRTRMKLREIRRASKKEPHPVELAAPGS